MSVGEFDPPLDLHSRILAREGELGARPPLRPPRMLVVALAAAGVALVILLLALAAHTRLSAPAPAKPIPTIKPAANGWLALDGANQGRDIVLTRDGETLRRVSVAGAGTTAECPALSPDSTRLLFGRLTKLGEAQLGIVSVDANGATGTANVIPLDGFTVLHGFDPHPCGTWSPDGRWIALAGTGAVWVVDTHTDHIRRLPNLRPSDLEWRPGTDELTIAGDLGKDRGDETRSTPVTVYSASSGERSRLGDVKAAHITWSPDGKTLAYTHGEEAAEQLSLSLVEADGTNNRLLVRDTGGVNHGIGPVWSPAGDRIVYQRLIPGRGEAHVVVVVNVADGTRRVIRPPWLTRGSQRLRWVPDAVWWAPDGKTLVWSAWADEAGVTGGEILTVPADRPADAKLMTGGLLPYLHDHEWTARQAWGRQPASGPPDPRKDGDETFHGLPAQGSRPTPTGRVVMGFRLIDPSDASRASDSLWTVYANGLLVWQRWSGAGLATVVPRGAGRLDTGYVQQRLTRRGVELLRSRMLATGLFKHDLSLSDESWFSAEVRQGDHLTELSVDSGGGATTPAQQRAIRKIEALIIGLGSWLPDTAWADSTIRPFVPSHYFAEFDGSASKTASPKRRLPSSARELIRSASRCGVITTAQARALLQALADAGVSPSRNVPRGIQYDWNALGVIHHGYSLMTVFPLTATQSRIEPRACRAP
jgi:WD40-like Beta Propeller Repeat